VNRLVTTVTILRGGSFLWKVMVSVLKKRSSRLSAGSRSRFSVGVLLIPLVLFRQNLFEPMGLLVGYPLIHERGLLSDDEVLTASIASQGTHFPEIRRLLSALTLCYWG
jgi:hypothetical protein